jgi:hypothetical protein
MVAKVKHTMKNKTMKHKKGGKKHGKKHGKTMKHKKVGKKHSKTMKHKKGGKKHGKKHGKSMKKRGKKKTMKGGFVSVLKDALVPLLFTAAVVKKGKSKSKSRSRK